MTVEINPSKVDNLEELRRTVDDTLSRAGWPGAATGRIPVNSTATSRPR